MKDESFNPCFAAFAALTAAILLRKTSPDSTRKEAFAAQKAMSFCCAKAHGYYYELGALDRLLPDKRGLRELLFLRSACQALRSEHHTKTDKFDWPVRKNTKGEYNIKGGKILATCFATDFFLPEADGWRREAWAFIRERTDIDFLLLTKRIDRFTVSLPDDWGDGYDNINIGCTVENQKQADLRLPLFLSYPIKRRFIACAPLLDAIDLSSYISGVDHVTVGGETGRDARVCDFDWVLSIRGQCAKAGKTFWFKNTGSLFRRDGVTERINPFREGSTARELGIDISDGKRLF